LHQCRASYHLSVVLYELGRVPSPDSKTWLKLKFVCPAPALCLVSHQLIAACREIESLKERYESKLQVEKNLAVTLKGENGLMRKRFNGLEKAIEEQKSEIRRLHEAQDTLYSTIATHEKDMQAFKEVWDACSS
jgi:alanine racemase